MGILGFLAGGYAALQATKDHCPEFECFDSIVYGAAIAGTIGVGIGAHLGNGRRGNVVLNILTAAGIWAAGIGPLIIAGDPNNAYGTLMFIAVPVLTTPGALMPSGIRSSSAAIVVCSLVSALPLVAQESAAAEPAHVLVLGTYHFANPGLDVVKTEVADVLSATKQAEVRAVVEALARFGPTKIAVEHLPASVPRLDSLYHAYRSGQHELSRDETEQLGFRLAAIEGHARIYPIDHQGDIGFEAVMDYAEAHDPAFVAFANEELARIMAEATRRQRENTIGEILRLSNEPKRLAREHGFYIRLAQVGAADTYVGAESLSKWYERNIHIFSNLQRIVDPGDRILVIIGSGHAPILRELISHDPRMLLVAVEEYLPEL